MEHYKKPVLLRKRYIPDEIVDISGDELLYRDENLLVTRWKAIKPRNDLQGGISYTFLNEGYKLGKFYNAGGEFLYWYCDVIDISYNRENDTFLMNDLLVDIKVMPDGKVRVLDADEMADALEKGLITTGQACRAMRVLNNLLSMIYEGRFPPEGCSGYDYPYIDEKGAGHI